jgi:hypothetical protein
VHVEDPAAAPGWLEVLLQQPDGNEQGGGTE